jgi:phosphatidate cytidylyltransferase
MTRVLSGAVLIVLVVAIVWFAPEVVFKAFAAVVTALAAWELSRLMRLGIVGNALFALVYIAVPLVALVAIRMTGGPQAVFLLMLTVMISDTAQYYTGRTLGRNLLAPRISPKKTIEGAIGGFVIGTLAFVVIGARWAPQMPLAVRIGLGLAIVALGIAGDLFESSLKRRAGVKDSSALIPGHGGVLDRIDALLFAAPAYFIVLRFV